MFSICSPGSSHPGSSPPHSAAVLAPLRSVGVLRVMCEDKLERFRGWEVVVTGRRWGEGVYLDAFIPLR